MKNLELLKAVYEGFQNDNMELLFSNLADDAVWKSHSTVDSPLPEISRGAGEIAGYFEALASGIDLHKFDIHTILGNDDTFAVLIDIDRKFKTNGSQKQGQYVHVIKFNQEGQLCAFDSYEPTA